MWELGTAFRGKKDYCKGEEDFRDTEHVIMLVSDPFIQEEGEDAGKEGFIVAAIMSYNGRSKNQEQVCILTEIDGNPPIQHNSYVRYIDYQFITIESLDSMLQCGKIYKVKSIKEESKIKLLIGLSDSDLVTPTINYIAESQLEKRGIKLK